MRRDACSLPEICEPDVALHRRPPCAVDSSIRMYFANSVEGTNLTKKPKQFRKITKSSKRTKVAAQPGEEPDTATQSTLAEAPQAKLLTPGAEVAVDPRPAGSAHAPATAATPVTPSNLVTRSDA